MKKRFPGSGSPGRSFPAAPADILKDAPSGHVQFMTDLLERGGPEPHEYGALAAWFHRNASFVRKGILSREAVADFWREVTSGPLAESLQDHVVRKPHGYAGDFEIIDRIYLCDVSEDERLRRWDEFFHAQPAPRAVRNRKDYFHRWLRGHVAGASRRPLRVLNLGSGPARDVREWCAAEGTDPVHFDCVDMDAKAIAHASALCAPFGGAVRFHHANVLRFKPEGRVDLVWSAGLFDYLSDRLFVRLLRTLAGFVNDGGEMAVGNFGMENPSRPWMEEHGDWVLLHRSAEHLAALAEQAGFPAESVRVDGEPEGINLFLHLSVR